MKKSIASLADAIGLGATNESDAKTSMTNKEYFIYEGSVTTNG